MAMSIIDASLRSPVAPPGGGRRKAISYLFAYIGLRISWNAKPVLCRFGTSCSWCQPMRPIDYSDIKTGRIKTCAGHDDDRNKLAAAIRPPSFPSPRLTRIRVLEKEARARISNGHPTDNGDQATGRDGSPLWELPVPSR